MHIVQLIHKPLYQALLFIMLTIVVAWIVRPRSADSLWVMAGLLYGCFILANAAAVFFAADTWTYFFSSSGISLLYLVLIAIIVKILINVLKLKGSEESAMVFLVVILHPVVLLLALFFKWLFVQLF